MSLWGHLLLCTFQLCNIIYSKQSNVHHILFIFMFKTPPSQLQALWAELKAGLRGVVQEISALQQSNARLEEKVRECQRDTAEKVLSLRNTLNTLQEDTDTALSQISELNIRQKQLQTDLDLLHSPEHRGEETVDGHTHPCSQTQVRLIQHYISHLPTNQSSEQDGSDFRTHPKAPVWRERRMSRDQTEQIGQDTNPRQVSALELLESERVYVSYLSLLLKANITHNGYESSNLKDKRLFPSSLRFLIQQHLELLHLLQERVLKSHWQGIMGDLFLRLTSKEGDFLHNYVSYLKELPECLSALSLFSKPAGLLEGDLTGDETRPSLHTLLLQPAQRVPEYLRLLQNLLCHTESEHPDYYLLLVCVKHLRSFTTQYNDLLKHNQELFTHSHTHGLREHTHNLYTHEPDRATHTRKEFSRSSGKHLYKVDSESSSNYSSTSGQTDPAHKQRRKKAAVRHYPDWEAEPNRFPHDISFTSDVESRHKATPIQLHRIPETERAGSALADAMETFLPYRHGDSRCSSRSHSTDSSLDITFVSCSPSLSPDCQSHSRGQSSRGGVYRPSCGRGSPDSASVMKPLQQVQRKSRSLNGLQLDSFDSGPHVIRSPAHPRLVRQSSAKSRLRNSSPERHHEPNTHTIADELTQKDSGPPILEDLKWKGVSDECDPTPLSERSRKEGKGFRSSFKKLFKKRSGGESKAEKAVEKNEGQSSNDLEAGRVNRARKPGDIDRGTAV
ncbi:rho guanine nucleotide exchange factor 33 isoform X1 [Silurus meridionalis]|uniref:rho guanine nucleotide exchange factor 33 isoform X1 n=1 Tax=Silurus meridionalis TaxID=175797 RepID=UPI001EEC55E7|nr:rho guanine nucleotide exchange factor 33 isoform X1 [Silurus meridionalis]XP_046710988.1 rho guanine nucleotide exchange factor 33 isoform X1 [Silurus meridionalis]